MKGILVLDIIKWNDIGNAKKKEMLPCSEYTLKREIIPASIKSMSWICIRAMYILTVISIV